MPLSVSEYITNNLDIGSLSVYPYSDDMRNMGFCMLIHPSTRIEDNKKFYQCTLFLKEKPYCHNYRHIDEIIGHIQSVDYKFNNAILCSNMCDEVVMELAEVSIIPDNEKIENTHKLVTKYNDKLSLIINEQTHFLIKQLFTEYVETDKYSIEDVEFTLNNLLSD